MSHFSMCEENGILYFKSLLFEKFSIPHIFSSSRGGVSKGAFSSLNVSLSRKDKNGNFDTCENVSENLSSCLKILGKTTAECTMMHQVHSDIVCRAEKSFRDFAEAYECDGIYTDKNSKIKALCVKTADCVPILLYDVNNDVACAIHAGWKGSVSGICANAVRAICEEYDNCRIIAAIGPHARSCCYEVDDAVYLATKETFEKNAIDIKHLKECFSEPYLSEGKNRYKANLSQINRIFLESVGVNPCDIDDVSLCTCCYSDEDGAAFFSHRTSGGFSGTQASVIAVK